MLYIIKDNEVLVLKYYPELYNIEWVTAQLEKKDYVIIKHVLHFTKDHVYVLRKSDSEEEEADEPNISFRIGRLVGEYWELDSSVLNTKYKIEIHDSFPIEFETIVNSSRISVFKEIERVMPKDIVIGGPREAEGFSNSEFSAILSAFPSQGEVLLYRSSRISAVLKDYCNLFIDAESKYHKHVDKKRSRMIDTISQVKDARSYFISDEYAESEYDKYLAISNLLKYMLANANEYTEKQWQREIAEIILLVYPKYQIVLEEVVVKDVYNNKNKRLDFALIDTSGNIDIIELKKPMFSSLLSPVEYRDNFIPMKELTGAIMQIEKYIYYLNKWSIQGEEALTTRYQYLLPKGSKVHITNPKGIVIMGRTHGFDQKRLSDFEIIKRKYSNILDIMSYDDLLNRVQFIIDRFSYRKSNLPF